MPMSSGSNKDPVVAAIELTNNVEQHWIDYQNRRLSSTPFEAAVMNDAVNSVVAFQLKTISDSEQTLP